MKKKIRSEIVKLANQIISEEETFDSKITKKIVGQLYEKLVVLSYLESQLGEDNGKGQTQALDSKSFREENWFNEPEPLPQSEYNEELAEPLMEKIKDIVAQMPNESFQVDEMIEGIISQKEATKNELEEFALIYQQTPTFERKEPVKDTEIVLDEISDTYPLDFNMKNELNTIVSERKKSLNDKLNQGLNAGLNDKLAFIKHLFDGKTEDYARVISQISTMDSSDDAILFIEEMVKPEYNNWLHKDEFSERFMSMVEKKFI